MSAFFKALLLAVATLLPTGPDLAGGLPTAQVVMPTGDPRWAMLCDVVLGQTGGPVCSREIDKATAQVRTLASAPAGVDGSGLGGMGSGQGALVALALVNADRPTVRSFATEAHPLHMDGLHDDAPVIQAAIAFYCALGHGGTIHIPSGDYAIATPITQPCSDIHLVGPGTGSVGHDVAQAVRNTDFGARFIWRGARGGTILRVGPPAQTIYPSTMQGVTDADVIGIQFDCDGGLAAVGLDVASTRGSRFEGASIACGQHGLFLHTVPIGDTNDVQQNRIWWQFNNLFTAGDGVYCGATPRASLPAGEPMGNCSDNTFELVRGFISAGYGLVFAESDHNFVEDVECINGSKEFKQPCLMFHGGTANQVDVAYGNTVHREAGGAVIAEGCAVAVNTTLGLIGVPGNTAIMTTGTCVTTRGPGRPGPTPVAIGKGVVGPSLYNRVTQLDLGDLGSAVVGIGARFTYETDAGNFFGPRGFGTDDPHYGLDAVGETRLGSIHLGGGANGTFIYPDDANGLNIRVGSDSHYGYVKLNAEGRITAPGLTTGTIEAQGLSVTAAMTVPFGTPASASTPCVRGQMQVDASYLYVCVATDRWHRQATGSAW